jgi:hypothetical protein
MVNVVTEEDCDYAKNGSKNKNKNRIVKEERKDEIFC